MQVNKCANKANSVLLFIRQRVGPKNTELYSKLYETLVCLILEYYSPVWCRHLKKTQAPWWNVEHPNVPLEILGKTCHMKNVLSSLNGQPLSKEGYNFYLSLIKCYKTINKLNGLDSTVRANYHLKLKFASATLISFKVVLRRKSHLSNLSHFKTQKSSLRRKILFTTFCCGWNLLEDCSLHTILNTGLSVQQEKIYLKKIINVIFINLTPHRT